MSAKPERLTVPVLLVVDDDPLVRYIMVQILKRIGYTVVEANGPEAALMVLAGVNADLAIVDVIMPGIGGLELAEQIRVHHPSVRILFITGDVDAVGEDVQEPVLAKPFAPDVLVRLVKNLLA